MNKQELRKLYKLKRMQLTAEEAAVATQQMLLQFSGYAWPPVQNLFAYTALAVTNEPPTDPFIHHILQKNPHCRVAYPVTAASGIMNAVLPRPGGAWQANNYGIPEPANGSILPAGDIDMIIVPLLAVDRQGHRAGYGKGYYDRFMAQCRPGCIRAGLSFFEPVHLIEGLNEFDVPLTHCITPEQMYVF